LAKKAEFGKESPQLVHNFVRDGQIISNDFPTVAPIIEKISNHFNIKFDVLRCKMNITYPQIDFDEKDFNPPHTDTTEDAVFVAIYYLNDSDGSTLFFDKQNNIIKNVEFKKGSLVCFNGKEIHAGVPPKNHSFRAVINFNFKGKY
jgi:hypothetical protein